MERLPLRLSAKILIGILMLCVLPCVTAHDGVFFEINHTCQENKCVPNAKAHWDITIDNRGASVIEVISARLIEYKTNKTFAEWKTDFFPHSDNRGDLFKVIQLQKKTLGLDGVVLMPFNGTELRYYVCFTNAINEQIYAKENVYELDYCYQDRIYSMPVWQCLDNTSCSSAEICDNRTCQKLDCGECEIAGSHRCVQLECCQDSQCGLDEDCENNRCSELDCGFDEVIFNHTCQNLRCRDDQEIINKTCVDLNCSYDEEIVNRSCVKLNCSDDEEILNRSCVKLDCLQEEYLSNHTCLQLNCNNDEIAIGHSCRPLTCNFFQRIENHACNYDQRKIVMLTIELLTIAAILFYLLLDIKRIKLIFRNN